MHEFVQVHCSLCYRLTELCALSACAHLLCIIETIFAKYYSSAVFGKGQSKFFTVFLTQIISRIIVKSEFKMTFFGLLNTQVRVAIITANPQTAVLKIG